MQKVKAMKKNTMLIWLMLIVSVFLGGMCVERVYVDSSFCMDISESERVLLSAQEYDVAKEDLLPADILTKQDDIVPIRNTKRESLRMYLRILMNLMLVT